jgi:hypothetical protein
MHTLKNILITATLAMAFLVAFNAMTDTSAIDKAYYANKAMIESVR